MGTRMAFYPKGTKVYANDLAYVGTVREDFKSTEDYVFWVCGTPLIGGTILLAVSFISFSNETRGDDYVENTLEDNSILLHLTFPEVLWVASKYFELNMHAPGLENGHPRTTVKSAAEAGIKEMAEVEEWRQSLIAEHGQLSDEMEDLFGAYRKAVRDRIMTRLEREIAEIMGMEEAQ